MMAPLANSEITKDDVREAVESSFVKMIEHARETPSQEMAGVVLRDGTSVRLINEARPEYRDGSFVIHSSQLDGLDVIAFYHSHPNDVEFPSPIDEDGLAPIPLVIITSTAAILWWYREDIGYYRIWDSDFYGLR